MHSYCIHIFLPSQAVTFKFSRLPWVGNIVYIIFLLLVPVLMLSMLIAMMGRTYELIEERSLMQWNRQVTIILCILNWAELLYYMH